MVLFFACSIRCFVPGCPAAMLYLSGLAVWALRRHRFSDANMPTKKIGSRWSGSHCVGAKIRGIEGESKGGKGIGWAQRLKGCCTTGIDLTTVSPHASGAAVYYIRVAAQGSNAHPRPGNPLVMLADGLRLRLVYFSSAC